MNKDQAKGAAKDAAGKLEARAGEVFGNAELKAKGVARQAAGKSQKAYGDLKEVLRISGRH